MRRIIQRIAARFDRVHFCYEAPTGYGLYRLITPLIDVQNWTPVTPPEGSIFHAETQSERHFEQAVGIQLSLRPRILSIFQRIITFTHCAF